MYGAFCRSNFKRVAVVSGLFLLSGCASVRGYPVDPENTSKAMLALTSAFDGTDETSYYSLPAGDPQRIAIRNSIIRKRLRGYDITYSAFERQLISSSNSISLGGDLTVLALGGLTATVGGTGAKAALGAASTGIAGANASINKDLFFQKTIPALISQMQANRAKALLIVFKGMDLSDDKYPLATAMSDLNTYRDAGSIPSAISSVTQAASNDRQDSQDKVSTFVRSAETIKQQVPIREIVGKLDALDDGQIITVMKYMDGKLGSRPSELRKTIGIIDQGDTRDTDASIARSVLNVWAQEEDMTSSAASDWSAALAAASK